MKYTLFHRGQVVMFMGSDNYIPDVKGARCLVVEIKKAPNGRVFLLTTILPGGPESSKRWKGTNIEDQHIFFGPLRATAEEKAAIITLLTQIA